MDRRDLLKGALAITGLPPLCCLTDLLPASSVAFASDRITVDLERVPQLGRVGAAFAVVDTPRKINLILIHSAHGQYVALDRTCTHGGAMCTYNRKRHTLQCTSLNHAEYDLRGTLLHGRTHGNLEAYEVRAAGSKVTIMLKRNV